MYKERTYSRSEFIPYKALEDITGSHFMPIISPTLKRTALVERGPPDKASRVQSRRQFCWIHAGASPLAQPHLHAYHANGGR